MPAAAVARAARIGVRLVVLGRGWRWVEWSRGRKGRRRRVEAWREWRGDEWEVVNRKKRYGTV